MSPTFSVVVPAYKSLYLKEAVASILSQEFTDFELVIVNDASPYDVDSIIREFNDRRIRYYVNDINLGGDDLVKQWNHCLQYAAGDYFVLGSDDDLYHPKFLSSMNSLIIKYPGVNVFHSKVGIIDGEGKIYDFTPNCAEWESSLSFIWHKVCKFRNQYMPEFVFKTSVLKKQGGFVNFPSAWGTDHATTFLMSKAGGVAYCSEAYFYWRLSGFNISGSGKFSKNKITALFSYLAWVKTFLNDTSFTQNQELIPLINKGLISYEKKRLPVLLAGVSYFVLIYSLINKKFAGYHIDRKTLFVAFLKKISQVR